MANWTIECADQYLAVFYDYLHKYIYKSPVIHADETPVLVRKDGREAGSKSYMWVYRTGEKEKNANRVVWKPLVEAYFAWVKEKKADGRISEKNKTGR